MKEFSDIRKGNPPEPNSPGHTVGIGEWHFTYEASEDPTNDVDGAGGIIVPLSNDLTTRYFVGGGVGYRGRVSTYPDTEDAVKDIQDRLREMGWTQKK